MGPKAIQEMVTEYLCKIFSKEMESYSNNKPLSKTRLCRYMHIGAAQANKISIKNTNLYLRQNIKVEMELYFSSVVPTLVWTVRVTRVHSGDVPTYRVVHESSYSVSVFEHSTRNTDALTIFEKSRGIGGLKDLIQRDSSSPTNSAHEDSICNRYFFL
ncbi:hypothetical protein PUN28_011702 [Cardiocondyla obscurior]|uniref:Uncharacterized protein n=1 Tax=Cardiocondyla obscurior TaxID=286306 RepID=A0AAW2FH64_9HYME